MVIDGHSQLSRQLTLGDEPNTLLHDSCQVVLYICELLSHFIPVIQGCVGADFQTNMQSSSAQEKTTVEFQAWNVESVIARSATDGRS